MVFNGCRHQTERGRQGVRGAGKLATNPVAEYRTQPRSHHCCHLGCTRLLQPLCCPLLLLICLLFMAGGKKLPPLSPPPRPPFNVRTITIAPEG